MTRFKTFTTGNVITLTIKNRLRRNTANENTLKLIPLNLKPLNLHQNTATSNGSNEIEGKHSESIQSLKGKYNKSIQSSSSLSDIDSNMITELQPNTLVTENNNFYDFQHCVTYVGTIKPCLPKLPHIAFFEYKKLLKYKIKFNSVYLDKVKQLLLNQTGIIESTHQNTADISLDIISKLGYHVYIDYNREITDELYNVVSSSSLIPYTIKRNSAKEYNNIEIIKSNSVDLFSNEDGLDIKNSYIKTCYIEISSCLEGNYILNQLLVHYCKPGSYIAFIFSSRYINYNYLYNGFKKILKLHNYKNMQTIKCVGDAIYLSIELEFVI